ncbi:hypothetical protein P7C73_g5825, partial [Tremellales sp. Uapishka_1]
MGVQYRLPLMRGWQDVEAEAELLEPKSPAEKPQRVHPVARRGVLVLLFTTLFLLAKFIEFPFPKPAPSPVPDFVHEGLKQCALIAKAPPHFKPHTSDRTTSDRFVEGTKSVWLKNATLWTGEEGGEEVLRGVGVLLEGGVIKKITGDNVVDVLDVSKDKDVEVVDLAGAWVTPGIVDMHSHMAMDSAPALRGADDTNSLKSAVLPWLRSLDAINTHDLAFNLSISGGITTFLALPGSAGNIGGQAFTFKPRWTKENTPQSMQVESPFRMSNGSWERTGAWRHIKHACGENPHRVYGNTRMDSAYDFRKAYTEGQHLKEAQDRWCASPKTQTEPFPTSLEWEVLSDVIRGNVKVNIHCYETVDLTNMVRISNEFKFPIAAFHHAHETYLVPDMLAQAYGGKPAIAIFATNARYKREAYRGTEFAAKILTDHGFDVCMKSDHPVLDSRYLVYEAAQAHHYGLNFSNALAAVTTKPAKAIGLDHRLGYIRAGYDADVVVWDSFPLTLGATPKQTYIDGIPQILHPHVVEKPEAAQEISKEGDVEDDARKAVEARGDPDLSPKSFAKNVVFHGVENMYLPKRFAATALGKKGVVVVSDGEISCVGSKCVVENSDEYEFVDLKGGSIAPGLVTVGSHVGNMEIRQEKSTWDGVAYDAVGDVPDLIDGLLVHGVDGAQFGSKDELLAYRSGVTTGVAYPISASLIGGLSYSFSTSSPHPLAPDAILNPAAALHLGFEDAKYSISTKIAILRRLLLGESGAKTELTRAFKDVAKGKLRVVVEVSNADHMGALVRLKREVAPDMKMTFLGGHEAWLVADDLAKENIGVIVANARSFPGEWNSRRILPGPPLSKHTLPSYLVSHGVTVGLGITEEWQARNTRYDAAWVYANSPEVFSKQSALDLVSSNLEELLGLNEGKTAGGWVAYEGDLFGFGGRVRAVKDETGRLHVM